MTLHTAMAMSSPSVPHVALAVLLFCIAKHNLPKVFSADISLFHRPNKMQPPEPRVDGRAMTLWE